jgi:hypothetical protein
VGGERSHVVFGKKNSCWKIKCETVQSRHAIASYFIAKVQGEVFARFHAVTAKRHISEPN